MIVEELCPCGKPLHYNNLVIREIVESMIERHGPTVLIRRVEGGPGFMVPRHYIALHGIEGKNIEKIAATYSFEAAK